MDCQQCPLLFHPQLRLLIQPVDQRKGGFDLPCVIHQLIEAKASGNRRPAYIASLQHYLGRFSDAMAARPITDIRTSDVEQFLQQFARPISRQTWLNRISTLFSFPVRRGLIPKNPCDAIERVRVDRSAPRILTPTEASALLQACPTLCRPYLILGLYAGIRPDELHRMNWADINLETRTVRITLGKTRRSRIVPLEPIAATLLQEHPLRSGPVAPSPSSVRRWKRSARTLLGAWPADLLRHTAASYLLALHGDAGKVATMLGNSSSILLNHYHTPVTQEDARLFWNGSSPR